MYKYCIIKGIYVNDENVKYVSYGVVLFKKHPGKFVGIKIAQDIFLNYTKAKQFIKTCNKLKLHPIHFENVIEDFL